MAYEWKRRLGKTGWWIGGLTQAEGLSKESPIQGAATQSACGSNHSPDWLALNISFTLAFPRGAQCFSFVGYIAGLWCPGQRMGFTLAGKVRTGCDIGACSSRSFLLGQARRGAPLVQTWRRLGQGYGAQGSAWASRWRARCAGGLVALAWGWLRINR